MDGLASTVGALYKEITVGGKVYRLAQPRLSDYVKAEAALLAFLPDPIMQAAKVANSIPAEQRSDFWKGAFAAVGEGRKISVNKLTELGMRASIGCMAFLALQRYHGSEIDSIQAALEWVQRASEEHPNLEVVLAAAQGQAGGSATANPTSQ